MDSIEFNTILERTDIEKEISDILVNFNNTKYNLLQKRGIYVYGAPGAGKTTFVKKLLENLNYDVIKYDAGDIRNKNIIDTITKDNMSDKNIVSMFYKKVKPIAIMMDEIDGMNNGDKGGINSLIKLIRPKKTKKQKNEEITYNPIICIGNYHVDKKIKELIKVCIPIELKKPTDTQMSEIVNRLMPELDANLRINMNTFLQGDLRKLASIHEIYRNQHSILKNEIIQKIFKPKSHNENTKEITQKLLNEHHDINKHSIIMNETDRTIVGLLWHENIIDLIEEKDKSISIPFYLDVLNNMCFADYMDRIIFQKQIWQLNEMSSLIKTFQSNQMFHDWSYKTPAKKENNMRFTKVLTKYSTEYNNSTFVQNLCKETNLDIKDLFSLFLKLRKEHSEEEIFNLFETYEISKLDISRMYRYLDSLTM